jgi:hypothetical protein
VLRLDGDDLPEAEAELVLDGKAVGRITSSAKLPDGGVVALAYVRREVPPDTELRAGDRPAEQLNATRSA